MLLVQALGGTMLNLVGCPIQLTRYFSGTDEGVGKLVDLAARGIGLNSPASKDDVAH
jgi:hypothetical protein